MSLGECITEKAGRVNLGLEGTLVMGAMSAYGVSYLTGSAWLGALVAGLIGAALGLLHGWLCSLRRVNDVAIGIALILFGTGLAFFLGKPFIKPSAPLLPAIDLGFWSTSREIRSALQINALFLIGVALAPAVAFFFDRTRWGLALRTVGESADAARAMGYRVNLVRSVATMGGGFLAGIGGSFLSLFYPRELERATLEQAGPHGRGPRDLRALEPDPVPRRVAPLRRGERAWPRAPIGQRDAGATSSTPSPTP